MKHCVPGTAAAVLLLACSAVLPLHAAGSGAVALDKSAASRAAGGEGRTMTFTVEKAVDYAMANSRTIKSADIDLEIKRRAAANSWNVFLPTVQVGGTLNRANDVSATVKTANESAKASVAMQNAMIQMQNAMAASLAALSPGSTPATIPLMEAEEIKETESMHWSAIGNLNVSLNLSLAYIEQIKAAKRGYEGGQISWGQTRRETVTNVKKLFYGLLLQQENVRLQQDTLENARRRSEHARINFENGAIPELRYLQASVAYENQKPSVADAQRLLKQQFDMFAFILGVPVGTNIVLEGDISPSWLELSAEDLLARYGSTSLSVRSLNNNSASLQSNLRAVNLSSWTSALSFSWGWQPMINNIFDSDTDWFDSDSWSDRGSLSVTLGMNLTNILPFSSNRQQAKDLKANIAKLELSMETVLENQKVQVRKYVDSLLTAREQMEVMRRNINLAQRSYNMTLLSYQNGATELLELRDTESQLYQAQLGLANQKYNYISALLDLENTLDADLTKQYASD